MTAQELFQELKDKIRRGELTGKLPSIAGFVRTYHISHNTVKKVLDMLKMQQLVYGQQGRGVFVRNYAKQKKTAQKVLIYCDLACLHNTFYLRVLNMLRQKSAADGSFTIDLITDIKQAENSEYLLCFIVKGSNPEDMRRLTANLDRQKVRGINLEYRLDSAEDIPGCHNDNFSGGYMAVEYLYRHGHRHIGILSCAQELPVNIFHYRLLGAEKFAADHPDCHLSSVNVDTASGSGSFEVPAAISQLRQIMPQMTAIFAFTDFMAMQSMHFLQQSGLKVPEDISIIGYDNKDFSGLLSPALTTIEEDAESFAESVCRLIRSAVAGQALPVLPPTMPNLIERASVSRISDNNI